MIAPGGNSRNKGGRPSKFTPEIRAKIIKALKGGNYRCVAARHAGVGQSVLARWLAWGRKRSQKYAEFRKFREAVLEAEAAAEVFHVQQIEKAAKKDYKASVEWLQRKRNERWSRSDRVQHTGKDGGPIQLQIVEELVDAAEQAKANGDSEV